MPSHVVVVVLTLQKCSVQCSLTCQTLLTIVRALAVSKVDYCNSVLAGMSSYFGQIAARVECHRPADLQNTSARYSANSTGCEFWRESNSGCVFWHFAAFTAPHSRTLCHQCRQLSSPPLGQHWSQHSATETFL